MGLEKHASAVSSSFDIRPERIRNVHKRTHAVTFTAALLMIPKNQDTPNNSPHTVRYPMEKHMEVKLVF